MVLTKCRPGVHAFMRAAGVSCAIDRVEEQAVIFTVTLHQTERMLTVSSSSAVSRHLQYNSGIAAGLMKQ